MKERLYRIWYGMKRRCYGNSSAQTKYYKDKGIRICEEWLDSFEAFASWARANGYQDDLSIDRVDSDGNYEPGNCRWIPFSDNARRGLENARLHRKDKRISRGVKEKAEPRPCMTVTKPPFNREKAIKELVKNFSLALPELSERDIGYFSGYFRAIHDLNVAKREKECASRFNELMNEAEQ